MKKIIIVLVTVVIIITGSTCIMAEEKETTTYTYDLSQYAGGNPEDYQYSFDKVNWTSENTWEVEVGKMYKLYVKYPDGYIGLVNTFIAESPTSGMSQEAQQTEQIQHTEQVKSEQHTFMEEKSSETTGKEDITEKADKVSSNVDETAKSETGNPIFIPLIVIIAVAASAGIFVFIKKKK